MFRVILKNIARTMLILLLCAGESYAIRNPKGDDPLAYTGLLFRQFTLSDGGKSTYKCSGTAVCPEMVVTASHCAFEDPWARPANSTSAGALKFSTVASVDDIVQNPPTGTAVLAAKEQVYFSKAPGAYGNNWKHRYQDGIRLLKIDGSYLKDNNVNVYPRPQLRGAGVDDLLTTGDKVHFSGYGVSSSAPSNTAKSQYAHLVFTRTVQAIGGRMENAAEDLPKFTRIEFDIRDPDTEPTACGGDSGGGLFTIDDKGKVKLLIGVEYAGDCDKVDPKSKMNTTIAFEVHEARELIRRWGTEWCTGKSKLNVSLNLRGNMLPSQDVINALSVQLGTVTACSAEQLLTGTCEAEFDIQAPVSMTGSLPEPMLENLVHSTWSCTDIPEAEGLQATLLSAPFGGADCSWNLEYSEVSEARYETPAAPAYLAYTYEGTDDPVPPDMSGEGSELSHCVNTDETGDGCLPELEEQPDVTVRPDGRYRDALAAGSSAVSLLLPVSDGSIAGTVISSRTGAPVAGALVTLSTFGEGAAILSALTDINGHYSFTFPPGVYDVVVSVSREGFFGTTLPSQSITVLSGSASNLPMILREPAYDVEVLPFTPTDINDLGEIVGYDDDNIGVHWQNGTLTYLGVLGDPAAPNANSFARAINNAGEIVGDSRYLPPGAAEYIDQAFQGNTSGLAPLPPLPSQNWSKANGINALGQAVGYISPKWPNIAYECVYWDGNIAIPIIHPAAAGRQCVARGINDLGMIVGQIEEEVLNNGIPQSRWRAFSFNIHEPASSFFILHAAILPQVVSSEEETPQLLGQSRALKINNIGQIVGNYQVELDVGIVGLGRARGFFVENGQMTDLGSLGGPETYPNDINNIGQVVGESDIASSPEAPAGSAIALKRAFLWKAGQMKNLNEEVPPNADRRLVEAIAINNLGAIIVRALDSDNNTEFVVLTPR